MKLELQQMRQQEGGCIINIASIAGLRGLPNNLAYVASKLAEKLKRGIPMRRFAQPVEIRNGKCDPLVKLR